MMNREIKFRVWNGKKFYYTKETPKIYPAGFSDSIGLFFQIQPNERINDENLILQQFTGLKDKNGREIYEGDLVLEDEQVSEVILRWGCFGFKAENGKICPLFDFEEKELEVVGNIFENPTKNFENNEF